VTGFANTADFATGKIWSIKQTCLNVEAPSIMPPICSRMENRDESRCFSALICRRNFAGGRFPALAGGQPQCFLSSTKTGYAIKFLGFNGAG